MTTARLLTSIIALCGALFLAPAGRCQSSCTIVVTTLSSGIIAGQTNLSQAIALAASSGCGQIDFAPSLAGGTHLPTSPIVLSNVTLNGDTDGDGDYDITINAAVMAPNFPVGQVITLTGNATLNAIRIINGPAAGDGVRIVGTPNNTVSRCVISGCGDGILVDQTAGPNTIGPSNMIVGSVEDGIDVIGAANLTIGPGNTIGNSTWNGIYTTNASNVSIFDNRIGTDPTGSTPWPNSQACSPTLTACWAGVFLDGGSTSMTISGNTISGNEAFAIFITGAGTSNNAVSNNRIGTNSGGTTAVPNGTIVSTTNGTYPAIVVDGGAFSNFIGPGNVISGNNASAILFRDVGTSGNQVFSNLIGVDQSGTTALPNGAAVGGTSAVIIRGGASANTIGPNNVISGNIGSAVNIYEAGTSLNNVIGNLIGLDTTGVYAIPNRRAALIQGGASNNTIGPGNVMSGNTLSGIYMTGAGATTVTQNRVGTDGSGLIAVPNLGVGIVVENAQGPTVIDSNLIAGNLAEGVLVNNSNGTIVRGNAIGLNLLLAGLGNGRSGVAIQGASTGTRIGGLAADGNLIAANGRHGIELKGGTVAASIIGGNTIGSSTTALFDGLGNALDGVFVDQSIGSRIGVSVPDQSDANTILGNRRHGVRVERAITNTISRNAVYGNGAGAIDLYHSTPLGQPFCLPGITDHTATTINGRCFAPSGSIIEIFIAGTNSSPGSEEDAEVFLGSTTLASNAFSLSLATPLPTNVDRFHVTVTLPDGTTSSTGEFFVVEYIYRNSIGSDILPGYFDHCAIRLPSDYGEMAQIIEALPATGVRRATLTSFLAQTRAPLDKNYIAHSGFGPISSSAIFDWVLNNPLYASGTAIGTPYSIFPGSQKGLQSYSAPGLLERCAEFAGTGPGGWGIVPPDQEILANGVLLPSLQIHFLRTGIKAEPDRKLSNLQASLPPDDASQSRVSGTSLVATVDGTSQAPPLAASQMIGVYRNVTNVAVDVIVVDMPAAAIVGGYVGVGTTPFALVQTGTQWSVTLPASVPVGSLLVVDVFFSTSFPTSEFQIAMDSSVNPGSGDAVLGGVTPELRPGEELRVPEDFGTVVAAVAAASSGASISIASGLYSENVLVTGKSLRLKGRTKGGSVVLERHPELAAVAVASIIGGAANGSGLEDLVIDGRGTAAGVFVSAASSELRALRIKNGKGTDGAAIRIVNSPATSLDCIAIHDCRAEGLGVVFAQNSTVDARNCTSVFNTSGASGYVGWYFNACPSANIRNSILGEDVNAIPAAVMSVGNAPTVAATLANPFLAGTGNITGDPDFVDPAARNLRLAAQSPAIDIGVTVSTPFDLLGNDRVVAQGTDLGAYETQDWIALEGTADDIIHRVAINSLFTQGSGFTLSTGGSLALTVSSPNLSLVGEIAILAVQLYTGPAPLGLVAIPEIHLDAASAIVIGGPSPLPANGLTFTAILPPGVAGFTLRSQGAVVAGSAVNGFIAVSNATDIALQ